MSSLPASVTAALGAAATISANTLSLKDESALASPMMDGLVRLAVFGNPDEQDWARWAIWELGRAVRTYSASIHDYYMARGRGDVPPARVPAMNVRGASYDTARAIFRTAKALKRNPGSTFDIHTFRWHNSTPFQWHSRQLLDLGLMEPGQWF